MSFIPPVRSAQYLLRHAVDLNDVINAFSGSDLSDELIGDILSGAANFASDVLAPINWAGDQTPARLDGDDVIASPGFKEAYQAWIEGGWQSLPISADIGGMGLPHVVNAAASEMFYAANMAFGLCPMLTSSAITAIEAHASDDLKATYLPKMVTGEWSGAMNLTEPHSGSDLGVLRAKAVPNADGTYAVTGQKIYITWGDHACADNIIHLVLARLPDAPAGSKGISLFLCPKYLVNEDGSLGQRNSFKPISLEHKLGIHGSPTCVMEFDSATGWLVGDVNRGLACMFTMMNEARLYVGVQGVGIGERAYQAALAFSKDRVQGRVIDGEPGAPIIGHPDVRRMLIDMKARLMGARAICLATAAAGDLGDHAREALLTPIAKAYGSDTGVDATSIGVQVFGGMGFVEETGAAQHYRDSRIAPIYEGTNGIQAIDLIGRKLRRDGGEAMRDLIADLEVIHKITEDTSEQTQVRLGYSRRAIAQGIETLKTATDIILNASEKHALSVATNYLKLCGDVISGTLLIKAACNGLRAGDPDAPAMQKLAWYHALAVMPQAAAQLDFIQRGEDPVFDFPEDRLADL
jgi:alkylation response protein AidB-like acyl-CoA dehydrogenase